MINGLQSIRRNRAKLERDRVVLTQMLEDAKINDAFSTLDDDAMFEGVTNDDIEDLINKLPESDDEDEEVERILSAKKPLNTDDIIGVKKDEE